RRLRPHWPQEDLPPYGPQTVGKIDKSNRVENLKLLDPVGLTPERPPIKCPPMPVLHVNQDGQYEEHHNAGQNSLFVHEGGRTPRRSLSNATRQTARSKVNDHVEGVNRFEVTRTIRVFLPRSLAGRGLLTSPINAGSFGGRRRACGRPSRWPPVACLGDGLLSAGALLCGTRFFLGCFLLIEVLHDSRHIKSRLVVRRHTAELFDALRSCIVSR